MGCRCVACGVVLCCGVPRRYPRKLRSCVCSVWVRCDSSVCGEQSEESWRSGALYKYTPGKYCCLDIRIDYDYWGGI